MKIEVIGLPGSGKTFLSKEKFFEFGSDLISVKRNGYRYFFVMLFCCFRFYYFFSVLKIIFIENKKNKNILKHKICIFFEYISNEAQCFFKNNYIIDQGFMYLPFSIFDRKIEEKDLVIFLNYYRKFCRDRSLFLIEVDEVIRQKRIEKRGRRPRSSLGINYAISIDKVLFLNKNIIYNFYLKNVKDSKIIFN
ncbi:MAG TPA: hypothetical protein PKL13_05050 [bacterium]|nr:hypothetical protein [bacterium]